MAKKSEKPRRQRPVTSYQKKLESMHADKNICEHGEGILTEQQKKNNQKHQRRSLLVCSVCVNGKCTTQGHPCTNANVLKAGHNFLLLVSPAAGNDYLPAFFLIE